MAFNKAVAAWAFASLVFFLSRADSRMLKGPERHLLESTQAAPGSTYVSTTAIAADRGSADAAQSAQQGIHTKTVIAVGNQTLQLQKDTPAEHKTAPLTWENAPACPFPPTAGNSHKDKTGRLWGWHNKASCAFKSPVYDLWQTTPPCPKGIDAKTGVKDNSGRLWGWYNNASCAFKDVEAPKTSTNAKNAGRQLLDGTALNGMTSGQATSATGTQVVTSTYGVGADAVVCTLITTPDAENNTSTKSTLKCNKAGNAVQGSTGSNALAGSHANNKQTPFKAALDQTVAITQAANVAPAAAPAATTDSIHDNVTSAQANGSSNTANGTATSDGGDAESDVADNTLPSDAEVDATPVVVDTTSSLDTNTTALLTLGVDLKSTLNRFGVTWEGAPHCEGKPSKRTAVQDTLGRLWWWEKGMSCTYRDTAGASVYFDGYVQVKWETAPACKDTATLINSMADAQGRLWGWDDTAAGENCKFMGPDGKPVMHEQLLQAVVRVAAAESTELSPK